MSNLANWVNKNKVYLSRGFFVKKNKKTFESQHFFLGCFIWNHLGDRSVVAKLALTSSYNYNTGKEEICHFWHFCNITGVVCVGTQVRCTRQACKVCTAPRHYSTVKSVLCSSPRRDEPTNPLQACRLPSGSIQFPLHGRALHCTAPWICDNVISHSWQPW